MKKDRYGENALGPSLLALATACPFRLSRAGTRPLLGLSLLALATACSGSSGASSSTLSFAALYPWDGGADAGCTISTSGVRVSCATAYRITGNPLACAGFDGGTTGSADTCKVVCSSGLVCSLAGLSDGTNAVDCSANCASPEY